MVLASQTSILRHVHDNKVHRLTTSQTHGMWLIIVLPREQWIIPLASNQKRQETHFDLSLLLMVPNFPFDGTHFTTICQPQSFVHDKLGKMQHLAPILSHSPAIVPVVPFRHPSMLSIHRQKSGVSFVLHFFRSTTFLSEKATRCSSFHKLQPRLFIEACGCWSNKCVPPWKVYSESVLVPPVVTTTVFDRIVGLEPSTVLIEYS